MLSMLALLNEERLTLEKILQDIPHDPAAVFMYMLLLGSLLLVWKSGRSRS